MYSSSTAVVLMILFMVPFSLLVGLIVVHGSTMVNETNIAPNATVSASFDLVHSVARASSFQTFVSTSQITTAGTHQLGRFVIKNNTHDGFSLAVSSLMGGTLHSESNLDGEMDIPYDISIIKTGFLGEGVDFISTIPSESLGANTPFSIMSHGDPTQGLTPVSSPTQIDCILSVVVTDDGNQMSMAGTYSDILTLTYTDD
jgi:hypothetical protein